MLTGLHTCSYQNERDYFIKKRENDKLLNGDLTQLQPQWDGRDDGRGSIAIGYGFDLLVNDNAAINSALTAANGQTTMLTEADMALLTDARARRAAGTATADYLRNVASQLSVSLVSEPAATTLLDLKLTQYETALDEALGGHSQLNDSKERIAILSLIYTMVDPNGTKIANKIPSTIAAIIKDNRAEAWYEIRYNSNLNGIHANRRYQEADLFGLYDSGPMTTDQAKEIMRMYTIHELQETNPKKKLSSYESIYAPPSSIGGIAYAINDAKQFLISNYGNPSGDPYAYIDQVIVGKGLSSYEYKDQGNYNDGNLVGTDGNDLIFGEKGNDIILGSMGDDVIYGGEGDDHITGGLGNDLLYGGAGNDTYYVNAGDGVDTIEDKEGNNRVILCGREINFFYEAGDGTYKSPDGKLTGVMSGGDFIVTGPDGVDRPKLFWEEYFMKMRMVCGEIRRTA